MLYYQVALKYERALILFNYVKPVKLPEHYDVKTLSISADTDSLLRAGHLCTVQILISRGADVNKQTTNNDHTPLSLACAGGHLNVVEVLLQQGADPYHKLKDNLTMLIEADKGGHTNVV